MDLNEQKAVSLAMLWLILVCLNCDVEEAQRYDWRASAVLGQPGTLFAWRREDQRSFSSRSECLRTIRRENPEGESGPFEPFGELRDVIHHPDYVEQFASIPNRMNGSQNIGCFSADRLTG